MEVFLILQLCSSQQSVPEAKLLRSLSAFPLPIPSTPFLLVLANHISLQTNLPNKALQSSQNLYTLKMKCLTQIWYLKEEEGEVQERDSECLQTADSITFF